NRHDRCASVGGARCIFESRLESGLFGVCPSESLELRSALSRESGDAACAISIKWIDRDDREFAQQDFKHTPTKLRNWEEFVDTCRVPDKAYSARIHLITKPRSQYLFDRISVRNPNDPNW